MTPMLLTLISTASAEPAALEQAYQREFAYLQEEKRSLSARLDALDQEEARRTGRTEAELSTLQARLLRLRSQREQAEDQLANAVRDADGVSEATELVESTLFQAQSTLGIELPEGDLAVQSSALATAYLGATSQLAQAGQLHIEPGQWFRADGTTVSGDIVRVGQIAAYGVGDHSGALVPVGEGKLQLHREDSAATARAIVSGPSLPFIDLFLFEDASKRVEEAAPKTWWSTIAAGGIVGAVILVLGAIALLLSVARAISLSLAGRGSAAVHAAIQHLEAGRWRKADELVRTVNGAGPRIMASLLPMGPRSRKRLEDRASEALLLEQPALDRFGAAILVIAAVAPLLGLLGTVTGMIGTFEIITEFGTGDPRMLSGGISEALVTTQLGLIVAIPALLVGNLLDRQAERVLSGLELAALGVINRSELDEANHILSPEPAPDRDHPDTADTTIGGAAHA